MNTPPTAADVRPIPGAGHAFEVRLPDGTWMDMPYARLWFATQEGGASSTTGGSSPTWWQEIDRLIRDPATFLDPGPCGPAAGGMPIGG